MRHPSSLGGVRTHSPSRSADGGAYSLVACLDHSTIDHASLSRRRTVPIPNRDNSKIWALVTFFSHILHKKFLHILSLSCFAFFGPRLSPGTAIVFSVVSSVKNISTPHSSISSSPPVHSVPLCTFHILPQCEFYHILLCHKANLCIFSLPHYWYTSFFFLAGPVPLQEMQFQRFCVVHWAV